MSTNNNENDILLWSRFKNGDEESFVSIFKNYYSDLFNYGCKITGDISVVEDCIQDLFIDLWRSNNKAEIISLNAYLFTAFKFKLLKSINKSGKIISFNDGLHENDFEISKEMLLINAQENKEMTLKIFSAMQQLSSRQKEIIYLKFYQELSYEEISAVMKINYQAVRNLVYQSIKVLKKIMRNVITIIAIF